MRHLFLVGLAIASAALAPSGARAGAVGVGPVLGAPTGIDVKFWIDDRHAVDAAVGWPADEDAEVRVQADLLWHDFNTIGAAGTKGRFPLFYGIGGQFTSWNDDPPGMMHHDERKPFGLRFPVGIGWVATTAPFDVFLEVAPVLDRLPEFNLSLYTSCGVRYWFR